MKFYACPMCCNKGFTSQRDLKEHLARATAPMKCPACLKSFKNLLGLIKHLDQCDVNDDAKKSPTKNYSEFSGGSGINLDLNFDNEDEDDVEGYFCTVCDVKIPEVEEHVRKFHSGQEVILQDDDEEDEDIEFPVPSDSQYRSPDDSTRIPKRKLDEIVNGTEASDKKLKVTGNVQDQGETEGNEVFYCPKCDMNFHSLSEHTSIYHKNLDVLVQDISIHELFSASRQSSGAFAYLCSCCQRTIVRKKTLAKHLKLIPTKDSKITKPNKQHNDYKKGKPYNSNNSIKVEDDNGDEQVNSSPVYEIEEVKPDMYDFDELGHSIFNT